MLGEVCYWILNMSIMAAFMGLIVMLIRQIRAIPRRVSVFLWIIPFVRMTVPVGLSNKYSLMTLISKFTTRTVTVFEPADDLKFSTSNTIMLADSYSPLTFKLSRMEMVFEVAGFIWIVIACALLIALMILYITTKRGISDAKHLEQNIYLSGKVDSPAVYGITRPKIILPESYQDKDLKYIIKHEKTHIRRLDNLWRIMGFFAVAVHWFNPLSWIFLKAFLTDIELACDEMAISGLETEERKDYARTLLNSTRSKSVLVSAFGGAKVRTRIENVLSYKRMTLFSGIGFAVLILFIVFTLITNAG
ncbi:MAG: peptidase M56 BlaR1 [Clostridiales bacterium]|nr:peptidase M56 BlaR1 [Clostridiales bacterium]